MKRQRKENPEGFLLKQRTIGSYQVYIYNHLTFELIKNNLTGIIMMKDHKKFVSCPFDFVSFWI